MEGFFGAPKTGGAGQKKGVKDAYAFKRLKERHKERAVDLSQLEGKILTADIDLRPYLNVATRWSEYLTRKEQ